jgi:RNA polymerase sigma-70 factor (ECF subfamily)
MEHNWQQILADDGPAVWRTVRCLLGNEADARDCYQTVFLEAFQFSRREQVEDWSKLLLRIARMRALDLLRKRYRHAAHVDSAATTDDAISRLPSPESVLDAAELAERLRASLAMLSRQQAEVFVMRYVEQLSYDRIGERTGSNRNAVGVMLNRARKQLRSLLDENVDADVNAEEASP